MNFRTKGRKINIDRSKPFWTKDPRKKKEEDEIEKER